MKLDSRVLRSLALATTSITILAPIAGAYAQDAKRNDIEEVVVTTGTNIRGIELHPVVNVQAVERERIEQSGVGQMVDLIKDIPANTGTNQYNENSQLSGTAQFALRGLGYSSTLTLLNGRRAGVAPLSDKSGSDFVDINQFPLAMIGRLDVLKDGSSAIYGSEAVAGVVNIVTRKGFNGLEFSTDHYSSTNDAYSINLAAGHQFDRGYANLYATYYHQTSNQRSAFDWLVERVGGNGVPGNSQLINNQGFPGTFALATFNAAGRPTMSTGAINSPDPNCQALGGIFRLNNGVADTTTCNFDFMDQVGVIPNEHRVQGFVEGGFDITDSISYFNESSFSRNQMRTTQAVGGYSNGAAVGGQIYVPANHPFNFFIQDPNNARAIIAINPAQWNPAIHTAVPVVGPYRPMGNFYSSPKRQTNTYMRFLNGIEANIGRWHAEVSHIFAHAEYQELNGIGVNAQNLNNMITAGTYNPFGTSILTPGLVSPKDGRSVAGNSAAAVSQVFFTAQYNRRTEQNVVDVSASGPVWDLPSGPIAVAVGAQYRYLSLNYIPDSINAAGLGTSTTTDAGFSQRQRVWSEYAEVVIPYHDIAQVQVAVRHEDFGAGVGATTDPKVTGRLNLFNGVLGLRASWGTSFQAPTLTQGSTSQLLAILNDNAVRGPTGMICQATTQGNGATVITTGGNLSPQNSKNINLGVDLKPLDSVVLNLDYWRYNYTNLIAAGQNAQSILSGECVGGVYRADARISRLPNGLVSTITTSYVNVGKVITDGLDLSASYTTSLGSYGNLALRGDATYVRKFDVYGANGVAQNNVRSRNFNNNFAPMPHWRGIARAVWSTGIHEVSLGMNYIGPYLNDQSFNAPVSAFTTVDWQYSLHFDRLFGVGQNTLLAVGMNNAFDRDPPALNRYTAAGVPVTGPLAVDRPGYDALGGANIQGRIIYARLKQTF